VIGLARWLGSDVRAGYAQVDAIAAQIKRAETRLAEMFRLQNRGTGRAFDAEQRQAEADQARAHLKGDGPRSAKFGQSAQLRLPARGPSECLRTVEAV
jgi:multidrug resistance efflux pump